AHPAGAQPPVHALECDWTARWASGGIRRSVVLGHSVGELAAAQAAGVFSLEDGMRFAARRGALLSETEPGTMAAIFAPAARVAEVVAELNASSDGVGLSLAADNGAHIVVSGPVEKITTIMKRFELEDVRVNRLNTTKAFHSPLVDPALNELEASLDNVATKSPNFTVISNLTGKAVGPDLALDGAYWRRHAREPVAFASGVRALAECNVDLLIEIGPHAVLGPMATLAWPDPASDREVSQTPKALSSLRRLPRDGSSPDPESSFVDAVAAAYEAGLAISFEGLFAGESRRRISLPGYPFQRKRHWLERSRHRRTSAGHPLLGQRHDSARGETVFETEVFPSNPAWLQDHRVFGRLVVPGALYGAMAATTALVENGGSVVVEDMQLHSPLVFPEVDNENGTEETGRQVQVLLDAPEESASRRVQLFSRGTESAWTLHVECRVLPGALPPETRARIDLDALKARLSPADESAYYRAKAATGINLGPFFRTLGTVWSGPGEALGEVSLPAGLGQSDLDVHPLVLDGCFQVVGVARNMTGAPGEATYLPFGWERLWLAEQLPDQVVCHVCMSEASQEAESAGSDAPEVLSGEVRIYDLNGELIGELSGYAVKRATQAALLAAVSGEEGVDDLLYEVVWRERPLESAILPADFSPRPTEIAADTQLFTGYLTDAGVDPEGRDALLADLERWSRSRALATLEELGWERVKGTVVDPEELRQELDVLPEHARLFRRLFEMLAKSEVLEETGDRFVVVLGPEDPLPAELPDDLEQFATWMVEEYPQGLTEIGLFRRSGLALAEVLRGKADPLTLLFSSGEPTAADLYLKAPVARAANRLLADAVQALIAALPTGRRLRVIEVGAGTGSATASVLPELPAGQFDYMYT
ncbi:MAG: acyltransferase domain-containing protein, partial [Chloroflexi bacterium]|nr:acyltransferase domain-containing protein [Chloroflexota bacterium]